ncbi:hypothetical protein C7M84_022209 [Penaeus vannamei]|uniref:Uncharacterized protein n=1 Tax=Penaeus vannamei TaxID=6689 RepID=A0A3R7QZE2_PENVA|nr:hypothetical protein C7M84_022209 [Penaeus vannamei]
MKKNIHFVNIGGNVLDPKRSFTCVRCVRYLYERLEASVSHSLSQDTADGLRIEPDEENETALECLEIVEEKIVVEDDIEECKAEENTCTAVTYVYNNPSINTIEKLCLQRDQMEGMTSVPLSHYLRTCEGDAEAIDSLPSPWNLEEEDNPHPDEDDFQEKFSASQQESISCQVGSNGMSRMKRDRDDTDNNCATKRARTVFGRRQRNPEWLEEELTSDLGSHQPWYLKVESNSHDSGVCCNSGQSPYYPHPLLSTINELYKGASPSQVEESNKAKKGEPYMGQIPHELYNKSGATTPCSDADNDLNTPQMTPVREADSQQCIFKDWTLSYTASGFDSDFERLWNDS